MGGGSFDIWSQEPQYGDVLTHSQACYRIVAVETGRHGYHDVTVQLDSIVERRDAA